MVTDRDGATCLTPPRGLGLALVVSVASIGINVAANKKKGCSALKENEQ